VSPSQGSVMRSRAAQIFGIPGPSSRGANGPQTGLPTSRCSAGVQAKAATAESKAMRLHYAAELLGMGTDDEKAIR
jgi:hypothetical protein